MGEHHQKFIATPATGDIKISEVFSQQISKQAQQMVASIVAKVVVVVFEIIQIDKC